MGERRKRRNIDEGKVRKEKEKSECEEQSRGIATQGGGEAGKRNEGDVTKR